MQDPHSRGEVGARLTSMALCQLDSPIAFHRILPLARHLRGTDLALEVEIAF